MTDDLPKCPYCNNCTHLVKKNRRRYWDDILSNVVIEYHYYVRCHKCFMRGPLMTSEVNAIAAFKHLVRNITDGD